MKRKGTLLVVLYNKPLMESTTLASLLSFQGDLSNIDLLIWNNGPTEIENSLPNEYRNTFSTITIHQDLSNAGLSKIYNQALLHNNNDFCIILDDDSTPSSKYLEAATLANEHSCLVPILTNNGDVQSPTVNKIKVTSTELPDNFTKFRAVGSGVVIGREVAEKMRKAHGSVFDERFLLYGVDMTFFFRLEIANLLNYVQVIPGFEHSYSRLVNDQDSLSDFRRKERAYDEGLRVRYYKSKISLFFYVLKLTKKIITNKDNKEKLYILNAIITGKHYRKK